MPEERVVKNLFFDLVPIWNEFKMSFETFPEIYQSGFLISIILGFIGVLIVARNQIFIGAAITQTSTFGIALAMALFGVEAMSDITGQANQYLILKYSIIAATICTLWAFVDKSFIRRSLQKLKIPLNGTRESAHTGQEAITGWLFLLSSAGAIVLVSSTPIGLEEVKKLTFSTIIGADRQDVLILSWLFLIEFVLILPFLNTILLVFTDRNYALSRHIPATLIEIIFALLLGVILGTTLKVSGSLYSFGCLVLPALIAVNLTQRTRLLFLLSPLIGLTGAVAGFSLGGFYNIPQAQLTIFIYSLIYPFSLIYKALFVRK